MFKKIWGGIAAAYKWLDGKKRRIAVVSGFVMTLVPAHTITYQIANGALIIFGGADAIVSGSKAIINKSK